eukprot:6393375-Pyramimonas_sp.AAC.1
MVCAGSNWFGLVWFAEGWSAGAPPAGGRPQSAMRGRNPSRPSTAGRRVVLNPEPQDAEEYSRSRPGSAHPVPSPHTRSSSTLSSMCLEPGAAGRGGVQPLPPGLRTPGAVTSHPVLSCIPTDPQVEARVSQLYDSVAIIRRKRQPTLDTTRTVEPIWSPVQRVRRTLEP